MAHLIVPNHERDLFTLEAIQIGHDEPMVSFQFPEEIRGFDLSVDAAAALIVTLQTVISNILTN